VRGSVRGIHAPDIVYAILLRAAGQAILDVAETKLCARFGVLTVLHMQGEQMK
jgi:hypothetical protein